ncbi:MAG: hypothetical protein DRO92_01255 [Candidatus Altiarchaeales archaeon]|nr:MAG: hypothetical protein DRO92_01255 [Candidatus Altiarchaeales archaeon]
MEIPKSHPRYESLKQRHLLLDGIRDGYVTEAGLIAHGRGEAFDYIFKERTLPEAYNAEKAGVALLLLSQNPVISVNGNVAALVSKEIVELAKIINTKIEVNLFYRTPEREKMIERILKNNGAEKVYGIGKKIKIHGLKSNRGYVDPEGIYKADTVLVSLEDGDRTEALISMKKNVIAIDLNPFSRTSQKADITIVDNISRAIPNMIKIANDLKDTKKYILKRIINEFNNKANLDKTMRRIRFNI